MINKNLKITARILMLIQFFHLLKCLLFALLYCMTSSARNKRLSLAIAVGLLMFSNISVWSQEVLYASTKYKPSQSTEREVLETSDKLKSIYFSYDESLKLETHGPQIVLKKKQDPKYTVSGYIRDAETGEELIGATIRIKELETTGAVTNAYGFYSITLPKGNYTVLAQYMGYKIQIREITLTENIKYDFVVEPTISELEEVVVTAE